MSSKTRPRRNLKSKLLAEPPKIPEKSVKLGHQTDISSFLSKEKDLAADNLGLPETSLPSPDAAALPCSSSCPNNTKNVTDENSSKLKPDLAVNERNNKNAQVMTARKPVNDVTSKKKNKKQSQPFRNSQITDFFQVRRSNRKPLPNVKKEQSQKIEEAILSGKEDGFEIREFPGKGRGIVTKMSIQRGDFVLEYYGELIDHEEAQRRESDYANKENIGCYMYYFKSSNKKYCIDATKESGRLGRLINHSKKGNLKTHTFYLKDSSHPHLVFFASRDIEAGEELCYDYGDRSKQALEANPWLAL